MPNRIIRDSCRTSPNLDKLSDGAERMFWRLTTVSDDFGRFQADPRILLSNCFPLKINCYKTKHIEAWLKEMISCELLKTYVCNGVTYGYFVTWEKHQHIRNQKSKFPNPTIENTCEQLLSNVPVIQSSRNPNVIQTESEEAKAKSFIPPTLEETKKYFLEILEHTEASADKFWNHFESNGWIVGKKRMVKWHSAAANWKANDIEWGVKNGTDRRGNQKTDAKFNCEQRTGLYEKDYKVGTF